MKCMGRESILRLFAVALGVATAGQGVAAQAASAGKDELEEVVVTANKREENLQKVATAIAVKQGEELRAEGKRRIDEIMADTVGVQAQDNRTGLTFFVRGVDSSTGNPGQSIVSPVAVIVDGVEQSRSEVVRGGTLDMARAEIMKGPQSTTLGANAAAGAVSLVSNQPVLGQYLANGSVDVGTYAKRAIEGVYNAPLGEHSAIRVAYSSEQRNGYISSGAGESDLMNVRAKLRWQPSDNLNLVLTGSAQHIGGNGVAQSILLATGSWQPVTQANSASLQLGSTGCASANPGITVMGCPATYFTTMQGADFRHRRSAWDDGFPARSFPNGPFRDTQSKQASLQVEWTTPIGTLTVLPAFQYAEFHGRESPRGASYMTEDDRQATRTLDVHLNSNSGGKATWIVGAYYNHDNLYNDWIGFMNYPTGTYNGGPLFVPGPPPFGGCTSTDSITCYSYQQQPYTIREDKSLYGNGEYAVTDKLRLQAGIRYYDDSAEQATQATVLGNNTGPEAAEVAKINGDCNNGAYGTCTGSASWKKTTYRLGAEYQLLDNTMLYAVYSTGYTPGRFGVASPGPLPPGFARDTILPATTIKQATLGWKGRFFENRMQFNGELFRTTFYNRAVQGSINAYIGGANSLNCFGTFPPPPGPLYLNAGGGGFCAGFNQDAATVPQMVSTGLDLEDTWQISADDRLTLTYQYLKAKYDTQPGAEGADYSVAGIQALAAANHVTMTAAQVQALSAALSQSVAGFVGAPLQQAPEHSLTAEYSHAFRFANGSSLTPRLAAVYKSRYWSFGGAPGANVSQIVQNPGDTTNLAWQQGYTKWDAYLGWQSSDGKLGINGYVKNLTNEIILVNYTAPYVSLEPPRTVGLIISAQL